MGSVGWSGSGWDQSVRIGMGSDLSVGQDWDGIGRLVGIVKGSAGWDQSLGICWSVGIRIKWSVSCDQGRLGSVSWDRLVGWSVSLLVDQSGLDQLGGRDQIGRSVSWDWVTCDCIGWLVSKSKLGRSDGNSHRLNLFLAVLN